MKRSKNYWRGYIWAMTEMIAGRETGDSIDRWLYDRDDFDYGAMEACRDWDFYPELRVYIL